MLYGILRQRGLSLSSGVLSLWLALILAVASAAQDTHDKTFPPFETQEGFIVPGQTIRSQGLGCRMFYPVLAKSSAVFASGF